MVLNIILLLTSVILTFPLSHVLMKKGMTMDFFLNDIKEKKIKRFFYLPFINIIASFLYLLIVIIKFKRFW